MGAIHRWLPSIFTFSPEINREVIRTGDQPRDLGHEIHLYRPSELRDLLESAGLTDVELHAPGWLSLLHDRLPDENSADYELLVEMELDASAESPGAGTQ